ncbi:MAG: type II toxin-antitoxin system HicA family toxin [Patescibacteria group bacterium]
MKRINLIRHIKRYGCVFVREGGNHSVFFNPITNRISTIPRHTEISFPLGRKICKDLGIQIPKSKQ